MKKEHEAEIRGLIESQAINAGDSVIRYVDGLLREQALDARALPKPTTGPLVLAAVVDLMTAIDADERERVFSAARIYCEDL